MKTLIEDFYQYPTWSQWQVAVTQAERIFLWKCKNFVAWNKLIKMGFIYGELHYCIVIKIWKERAQTLEKHKTEAWLKVIPTKEGERISVYISQLWHDCKISLNTISDSNPPCAGEVIPLPGLHVRACLPWPSIFLQNIVLHFSTPLENTFEIFFHLPSHCCHPP